MNLQDLKKEIPFKWRVQSANQYGCTCVAYIDARDVQDILDEVCGVENWQCKYEEHKGNLFCSIGIDVGLWSEPVEVNAISKKIGSNWIWKSDCGTESNIEKQKGESSDAFKRAAVMWGVGRFLYSLKIIKIKEVIEKSGKYYPALNGQQIWDVNKHCNNIHLGNAPKQEVKRKESLTTLQFETTKQATSKQIQTVLNTFRMSDTQRQELKLLL